MKKQYSIFDAHCDTLSAMQDSGQSFLKNTLNTDKLRMSEYNKYTQAFACFIPPEYRDTAMDRFNALCSLFYNTDFDGIDAFLTVEGGEMIRSISDLTYLYDKNVRAVALTWNNSNLLGGGADDCITGLTAFGKSVVKKMDELGIIIDVSHLNDKTFFDVASVTGSAIVATHSNSRSVCNHRRNLTDDMFKIICESGGCVGINLYPPFLTEDKACTSEHAMSHILRFLDMGGEDHIGIGADFDGTDNHLPSDIHGCEDLYIVFDKLKGYGVTDDIIEKISHKNFERVFGRKNH